MARGNKKSGGTPAGYGAQPIATTGGQYGSQAASAAAQSAVPLPRMGVAGGMGPAGPPMMQPGEVPLDAPTGRPNEPITNGASFGDGKSLQDLALPTPQQQTPPVDPELFGKYLPQLEAVASMPNSSPALRTYVRRLRAQLPVDFDPTGNQ